MPKDFLGRKIEPGAVIAVAMMRGKMATLQQRFVREVHEGHLIVQPGPDEPEDRRQIARVTNFRNALIIS